MTVFKERFEKVNVNDMNKRFFVQNGKANKKVKVNVLMIGHKFGEFTQTRKSTRRNKNAKIYI
jgi:ribosomal protein S19